MRHNAAVSHVLILQIFRHSALDVLEFYLRRHDVTSTLMTRYSRGALNIIDKVASSCCYDPDFECLRMLLQSAKHVTISDIVITSKLNAETNEDAAIVNFIRTILTVRGSNQALVRKTRKYMFEFEPDLLEKCLECGVDPTELTVKPNHHCCRRDVSVLQVKYDCAEKQHFRNHITTLITAANSSEALNFLHDLYVTDRGQCDVIASAADSVACSHRHQIEELFSTAGLNSSLKASAASSTSRVSSIVPRVSSTVSQVSSTTSLFSSTNDVSELSAVKTEQSTDVVTDDQTHIFPVQPLTQLCRVVIRHNATTNVIHAAPRLGLPPALQDFILLR